ncbi:dipeptide ABC transporter ATP-binding protein [Zobellella iuensis]|uniref:ABC transporter ATP-binding protein n=1 Tax=Zobellella iuensis TaxID=2803811 RepID=A0ABS1QN78_9GAMM|nr:ABC transporter ATP-binding protein [Zobellella iuensis]MBL1376314.1 ABC transporter ATP-binding protein [Zobellella iuensis]
MSTAILETRQLSVDYGGSKVVRELDLALHQGETLALVGESGCGKSTTALALMGLLPAGTRVEGEVLLEGQSLLPLKTREWRQLQGNRLAMIFQEPLSSLNPVLTIGEQLMEVLYRHRRLRRREGRQEVLKLLEMVHLPGEGELLRHYPHQLSGGQRQRVMIAMAVACRPRVLIADEPTTALDVTTQAGILDLLDELRRQLGMGVLLITHDLGVVSERADRVMVMHAGRVLEQRSRRCLFERPRHPYSQGLIAASLGWHNPSHYRRQRLAEIRVTQHEGETDHRFELSPTRPVEFNREPVIRQAPLVAVESLVKHYPQGTGQLRVLDDISLQIQPGETLGLVGESGCGKSTLGKCLLRLMAVDQGRIHFDGEDITRCTEHQLRPFRRRAQMVFQDPYGALNPRHRIGDAFDAVQRLLSGENFRQRQQRARKILSDVGLSARSLGRYPHEFSGGQRQRIVIARALLGQPDLLVCDEAVSALDVSVQAQILNLLVELKAEYNLSYLFISHDLAVVRYIADRVLVMARGRIVEQGDHEQIWTQPRHPYTRKLLAAIPRAKSG